MNERWKLYKAVLKVLHIYGIKIIWENRHFLLSKYPKEYNRKILVNNSILKEANLYNPDLIILSPNKRLAFVKLKNNNHLKQSYKDNYYHKVFRKYDSIFLLWNSIDDAINFVKEETVKLRDTYNFPY